MPKLPQVSGKELVKALKKLGYQVISQKGSHIKMVNDQGQRVIIPNHSELKKGTLRNGILKPLGITIQQLIELLN